MMQLKFGEIGKKTKPFLMFFFITTSLFSQGSFPTYKNNSQWNVIECFWTACHNQGYTYRRDTTFCGEDYSVVQVERNTRGSYVRVEGQRVYGRRNTDCSEKEYLLYDFSLSPGQSIYIGYSLYFGDPNDTVKVTAIETDSVNLGSGRAKRIKLLYNSCNDRNPPRDTTYWIEGVGNIEHPFYSFVCLCSGCESGATLICYRESGQEIYKRHPQEDCDVKISNKEINNQEVKVNPNPFRDEIRVAMEPSGAVTIRLFSIDGRMANPQIVTTNGQIVLSDLQDLESGIHILSIESQKARFVQKLIKN